MKAFEYNCLKVVLEANVLSAFLQQLVQHSVPGWQQASLFPALSNSLYSFVGIGVSLGVEECEGKVAFESSRFQNVE